MLQKSLQSGCALEALADCCVMSLPLNSRRFSSMSWLRALAVALLCLASPSTQDVVLDVVSWATGADCCLDACDETGKQCTQQCAHCSCSPHMVATLTALRVRTGIEEQSALRVPGERGVLCSGHLEPPFRPPVS